MKKILLFTLVICNCIGAFAQNKARIEEAEETTSGIRDDVYQKLKQETGMSELEFESFRSYYVNIIANDVKSILHYCAANKSPDTSYLNQIEINIIDRYVNMYQEFKELEINSPSEIAEAIKPKRFQNPTGACNPANDNLGFEDGTLSGWTCGYASCAAEATLGCAKLTKFEYNTVTWQSGNGLTKSAGPDSATGKDYQVTLESGGEDIITGVSKVCPGYKYSAMIGDSIANSSSIKEPNSGVGFLEQSFNITDSNAYLFYSSSVILENQAHCYYQQPYFNVAILDNKGDTIQNTNFNVSVSSFNGITWDTVLHDIYGYPVNYLPWVTSVVNLQKYIGQCVTIIATASDCGPGGHYGYAYFVCKSGKPQITISPSTICSLPVTLIAPYGANSYQWTGPGIGCVASPGNTQSISGTCAGKYSVIMQNIYGLTADTLDTVIAIAIPTVNITGKDSVISGLPDTLVASGGDSYLWNTGTTSDTLIVSPTTATEYTVYAKSSGNCSDSSTFTIGIQTITSLNNIAANNSIMLYPNPVSISSKVIFNEQGIHYLELYDIAGRKLNDVQCSGPQYQFSAEGLAQGIYLLKVLNSQMNSETTLKVVIE